MADFFDPWEKSGLRAATDDFYDPWSSRSQGRVDNQSIVQSKAPSSNYEDIYKELGYYGYMGVPDKEAMKPFTAALKTAPFQIANGIATFIDQINELSSGIPREKEDRIAWRAARYFDDLANKNAPDFGQGSPEYYVYSTLSSVFQNAPGMVLGTLTGSRVLGLGLMGTNVAGQKYYELTEKKGVDPWKARMISGLYGAAEVLGEYLPMKEIINNKGLQAIWRYSLKEIPGELSTEIMQTAIDWGLMGEKITAKEFASRMIDTAIITAIASPITGGLTRGMARTAEAVSSAKKKVFSAPLLNEYAPGANAPAVSDLKPEDITLTMTKTGGSIAKVGDRIVGRYSPDLGLKITEAAERAGNRFTIANALMEHYKTTKGIVLGEGETMDTKGEIHVTEERQKKTVKEILDSRQAFLPDVPAPVILLGGPSGAGKSTSIESLGIDKSEFVHADADLIKKIHGHEDHAPEFHEASSTINKKLTDAALDGNYALIYDSLLSNLGKAQEIIEKALKLNRPVSIAFTNIDFDTSQVRSQARKIKGETRREIKPAVSAKGHNQSAATLLELMRIYKDNPKVNFVIVDNNVDGRAAKLIYQKKNGKETVFDREELDRLLAMRYNVIRKGDETHVVREDAITAEEADKRANDRAIRGRVRELVNQFNAQRPQGWSGELRQRSGVSDEGIDEGKAWQTSEVTGDPLFNFSQSYEDFIQEATGDKVFGEPTKSLPQALTDQDLEELLNYAQRFDTAREFADALGEKRGKGLQQWKDLGYKSAYQFWREVHDKGRRNYIKGNPAYPILNFVQEMPGGESIIKQIKAGKDLAYDKRLTSIAQKFNEEQQITDEDVSAELSREVWPEELQTRIRYELAHFENHKYLPPRSPIFDVSMEGFLDEETGELIGDDWKTEGTVKLEAILKKLEAIRAYEQSVVDEKKENLKDFRANRLYKTNWSIDRVKQVIRERTGITKIGDMVNELTALNAAMKKAEQASRAAFREGNKQGALEEHERMVYIETLKRNKAYVIERAKKGFEWIETFGKKYQSMNMAPEYKDVCGAIISYNAGALQAFVDAQAAAGDPVFVDPEQIELLAKTDPNNLSLDELENQVELLKVISYQGKVGRKIELFNEKIERADLVNGIVTEIADKWMLDLTAPQKIETPSMREAREGGLWGKFKNGVDELHSLLLKAEYIFDKAVGWDKESRLRKATYEKIAAAENVETMRGFEIGRQLREAFGLIKDRIYDLRNNPRVSVYTTDGQVVSFTGEESIMVALNSGNEGNRDRLRKGYMLDDAAIDRIVDSLDGNEAEFVQKIWAIIDGQRPALQEQYRKMTGQRMKVVAGNYFPIITDKELSMRAKAQAEQQDLFQQIAQQVSVWRGMTIARVGGSDAPLLKFDVIPHHLQRTNHFIAYGMPVREVNRILNDPMVKTALIESVGENQYNQLVPWLKHVANPTTEVIRAVDKYAGLLRRNTAAAILGYSLSVALVQPTAYGQAINRMGLRRGFAALRDFYGNYGENVETIYRLSPFMLSRTQTFDADLYNVMQGDTESLWKDRTMKESFFALMSWTDKMVTFPTWWAEYTAGMKEHGDQARAAADADKFVRNTQSSGMPKDLAEVQRGSNVRKLFNMFYTYFSSTYNEMTKTVDMVRLGAAPKRELFRSFWWLIFLPALFSTLLRKREETTAGDIVKGVVGYGAASVPILGSAMNTWLENYEFRPTPVAQIVSEIGYTVGAKDLEKGMKHGVATIGYFFGLPTRQALLTFESVYEFMDEGEFDPTKLVYKRDKNKG